MPNMHNTVMFGMMHVKYHPLVSILLSLSVSTTDVRIAVSLLRATDSHLEYDGAVRVH